MVLFIVVVDGVVVFPFEVCFDEYGVESEAVDFAVGLVVVWE